LYQFYEVYHYVVSYQIQLASPKFENAFTSYHQNPEHNRSVGMGIKLFGNLT